MESAFPRDDGRFTVLPIKREYELMCGDIDAAVSKGWTTRLGDLYGVTRRRKRKGGEKLPGRRTVHVPDRCEIPRGYGTIKGKSWLKLVVKGRPITPHTKHVLRRISRNVARAHHAILTQISDDAGARMYATQEYKRRLAGASERMAEELRRAGVPPADIGFVYRV